MKAKNIGWAAVLYIAGVAALYRSRINSDSQRDYSVPGFDVPVSYSAGPSHSRTRSVSASQAYDYSRKADIPRGYSNI